VEKRRQLCPSDPQRLDVRVRNWMGSPTVMKAWRHRRPASEHTLA
jgi:hypothetical protein